MTDFKIRRRSMLAAAGAAAVGSSIGLAMAAEAWPDHPVKLIVPFTPGGPTDTIARMTSEKLQELWKQVVIVDYKPGAGTILGTQYVARSPADGYTLGMAISALTINPGLQPGLPYDTRRDLVGVSQIAQAHYGVFAHPSMPFDDAAGLIAYAKAHPGKLSYATPGVGTGTHLAGEMLKHMAGIEMVHVPYKGSAPAQQDVMAGTVPLLFDVMFSAMPFVRDKRLKAIALASPKRAVTEPQIGLLCDVLPGFSAMSNIGIIAPSAVPQAVVQKISADVRSVVRTPSMVERMAQLGTEALGTSPEDYTRLISTETDKWTQVIKDAGVKAE